MLAAQRLSFDNDLMFISPIIAPMPANTMMAALTGVSQSYRPTFLLIVFSEGHQGTFSVSVKIIDVFSVRRKELFWQYKLGTFIPNGLNERAADVELDMFACGIALLLLTERFFHLGHQVGGRAL